MGFLDRFRKGPVPTETTQPHGAVGRGHTDGFLDYEELNTELVGAQGLKIFDKMYRTDGDVRQVVQLVSNPISGGTWQSNPYGGKEANERARYLADFVWWALMEVMSPNWPAHLQQLLPILIRSGYTPYQILWMRQEYKGKTVIVPRKLDLRLPRTIYKWHQDKYGDLFSIIQQLPVPLSQIAVDAQPETPQSGLSVGEVELRARDLVYYRVGAEGDNWEGVSLLRPAYKHWKLKDAIERIDAIAQEREAMGVPICYPPMSATDDQLDAMETVLANMRTNEQGYIIAPGPKAGAGAADGTGWLIEVLGYDRTGSGRDPQPSLEYHTRKIAAAFISEFMRLGHGQSGARATAQVQAEPFQMSVEALTTIVEHVLNEQLVKPLIAYNFPDATEVPRLKMSQVDSTSLTQLADYILKLTQVGALLPDQPLEDFLRARADLPPADPEVVAQRKAKADEKIRREIVTGGGQNGDAQGQTANSAGKKAAAGKHGTKNAPAKDATTGRLEAWDDGVVTLARMRGIKHREFMPVGDDGKRVRYRDLDQYEQVCNMDGIEDYLDDLPDDFRRQAQGDVMRVAVAHAIAKNDSKADQTAAIQKLRQKLLSAMGDCYARGMGDASTELEQVTGVGSSVQLASNTVRDRGPSGLNDRVDHAVRSITSAVELAADSARLNHGDSPARVQAAAETAGESALRQVAQHHGQGSYMQGRHDVILEANSANDLIGVRYTAILDDNTCGTCDEADDGVVRRIDDPVRLDRRPPNRHCESTASGRNHCRCFEVPALME
jgi:hypothetical protein